jgi:hypothetical protein
MKADGEHDVPLAHRGIDVCLPVECTEWRGSDVGLDWTQAVDAKDLDRVAACVTIFEKRQRRHE